jgi:flagellar biosynthesis protein FlhB
VSGTPTEKPTPKRLRDARGRGEVAVSRELTSAVALAAGLLAGALGGASRCAELAAYFRHALGAAARGDAAPGPALLQAAAQLAAAALLPLGAAALAACACGAAQTGALFTLAAAAPRWSRMEPLAGFRRLFSGGQVALLGLALLKVAGVGALAWSQRAELAALASSLVRAPSPAVALRATFLAAVPLASRLCLLLLAFGAADLLLARRRHERSLRMTLDEVRREAREQDGDPQHKAERRSAHRAIATTAPAARATCVVVNPTHLAVALHHDPASEAAPVVLAKGSGDEARRIRLEALRAAVPVVRDVPLARALFRLAEVGDEIPEELYHAAAAVLVHVHGLAPERRP